MTALVISSVGPAVADGGLAQQWGDNWDEAEGWGWSTEEHGVQQTTRHNHCIDQCKLWEAVAFRAGDKYYVVAVMRHVWQ